MKKRFNAHLDAQVVAYLNHLNECERVLLEKKKGYRMKKGEVVSQAVKETEGFRVWAETQEETNAN